MSHAVKEVFYTLQGEGAQAGRAAVFIRFAGCNLWSGREADRGKGPGTCSRWCDTDFVGTDGVRGGRYTAVQLAGVVAECWPRKAPDIAKLVVCTGGEPLLQLDRALLDALHERGFRVAVETNGTQLPPAGVDWICVSPKAGAPLELRRGNELKLVYPQDRLQPDSFSGLPFEHFFLQPMDGPELVRNAELAARYCLDHPQWRLSFQMHKALGLP